ncbi:MAG: hypothetical protein ACRD2J_16680 [Thermoanaerobaculia bacterium]
MAGALLFILYCIEAGAFFVVIPWTRFWTTNELLHASAAVAAVAENGFVRGLVSGFGVAHLVVAFRELTGLFRRREETEG